MVTLSRRTFLSMALLPWLAPAAIKASQHKPNTLFINGHINPAGQHFVSGISASGSERFSLPLPGKAHGFAVDPSQPNRIIALPSLPGTRAAVINTTSGKLLNIIQSQDGRHFNGHGCFSPDGEFFFSSENIADTAEGVITVRDGRNFRFLREMSAHGIGPHDIHLLPDGITLVIAGGGIQTHPDSGKRELNINKMRSALLFIDSRNGVLLMRRELPTPKLSIRHLDIGPNGEVLVACQYKGRNLMPKLVGIQSGDGEIEMLDIDDDNLWTLKNYTASIRVNTQQIAAVTCPRGNQLTLWSLRKKQILKSIPIKDVGGIELSKNGRSFIASANEGELYRIDGESLNVTKLGQTWSKTKWTNHMVRC